LGRRNGERAQRRARDRHLEAWRHALIPTDYRERLGTGIVHFGPGAFHRAHQADYFHRLAAHDPRWGVAAVSLRSGDTIDALRRQAGLYTLAILDQDTSFRTIGVHNRFFGPNDVD